MYRMNQKSLQKNKIKTLPLEQSYMEDPEEILECINFHIEWQANRQFIELKYNIKHKITGKMAENIIKNN